MKFTKMHGAGNDYIYVDCTQSVIDNPSQVAIDLSDRHFGVVQTDLFLLRNQIEQISLWRCTTQMVRRDRCVAME